MTTSNFFDLFLPTLEEYLQVLLRQYLPQNNSNLEEMVRYHMGWNGDGAGRAAQGKRIRPILAFLSCNASGGNWHKMIPMASAIEYIHNFSLIHDDIQDKSLTRRGRPTVWVKWGIAQAINTGDFMFTLAHLCTQDLLEHFPTDTVLKAQKIMDNACIELTYGQHLDLLFEEQASVSVSDYWRMIEGKTAALLGCATETGSMLGNATEEQHFHFKEFGRKLGIAFQVVDDWLGIWGDEQITGKSNESDLVAGKKTLPILYAFEKSPRFSERWKQGNIHQDEIPQITTWMVEAGAKEYTEKLASQLTQQALTSLEYAAPNPSEEKTALLELAIELTHREK